MLIETNTNNRKTVLSTLWIFYLFNILYADVLNLMGDIPNNSIENDELITSLLTPEMLLAAAIFLETAMVMIFLSRLLTFKPNRIVNIVVSFIHLVAVIASLFVVSPPIYYIFFATVEVSTSIFIIWYAWTWKPQEKSI